MIYKIVAIKIVAMAMVVIVEILIVVTLQPNGLRFREASWCHKRLRGVGSVCYVRLSALRVLGFTEGESKVFLKKASKLEVR